jgi:hypothetical protein
VGGYHIPTQPKLELLATATIMVGPLSMFHLLHMVTSEFPEARKHAQDEPGVVVCACNPSTRNAKARGSQIRGQLGLHSETKQNKDRHTKTKKQA